MALHGSGLSCAMSSQIVYVVALYDKRDVTRSGHTNKQTVFATPNSYDPAHI